MNLNIWAPANDGSYPVYVWVHGGGNVVGSARMPRFDGASFARAGIVCVTLNYRLGVFGFTDMSSLLGAEYAGSGNKGLLDIIRALQWVRENIADFGGDPDRVCLGGQSAGGKNIGALLAMPAAKGLFQRAIIESGGASTVMSSDRADAAAALFGNSLSFEEPQDVLRAPPSELLAAQLGVIAQWDRKGPFRPVVDKVHLHGLPIAKISGAASPPVELLMGTNRDESVFFGPAEDGGGIIRQNDLSNMALQSFEPIYEDYAALYPQLDAEQRRYRALSAGEYWIPTIRLADVASQAGGKVWLYRFEIPSNDGPFAGYAEHGAEIPYIWGDRVSREMPLPDEHVGSRMREAFLEFIRAGNPAPGDDFRWPRYVSADRQTMVFSDTVHVERDPARAERRIWNSVALLGEQG